MKKIIFMLIPLLFLASVFAAPICDDEMDPNVECEVVTPVLDCGSYTFDLINLTDDSTLTNDGAMTHIGSSVYNFTFDRPAGQYLIVLCDNSTATINVRETQHDKLDDLVTDYLGPWNSTWWDGYFDYWNTTGISYFNVDADDTGTAGSNINVNVSYYLESGDVGGESIIECYFKDGSSKVNRVSWSKWITEDYQSEIRTIAVPAGYVDGSTQEIECRLGMFTIFKSTSSDTFTYYESAASERKAGWAPSKAKIPSIFKEDIDINFTVKGVEVKFYGLDVITLILALASTGAFIAYKRLKKDKWKWLLRLIVIALIVLLFARIILLNINMLKYL